MVRIAINCWRCDGPTSIELDLERYPLAGVLCAACSKAFPSLGTTGKPASRDCGHQHLPERG